MASLLSWGKKKLNAAYHGINPLDNGQGWTNVAPPPRPQSNFNLRSAIGSSLKEAPKIAIPSFGAGIVRSAIGLGEGLSGLYDLATPGTGTSRFTKKIVAAGGGLDEYVKRHNLDTGAYKIGQLTGEVASFLSPSAAAKATSQAGKFSKGAKVLSSTKPFINKPVLNLVARPSTLLNAAVGTTRGQGYLAARGQDINPRTVATSAGINLALGGGINVAAPAVTKLAQGLHIGAPKVAQKSAQAISMENNPSVAALRNRNDFLQRTWETTKDKNVRNQINKQIVNNNAEIRKIKEGGYAKIPGKKIASDLSEPQRSYINDYANMLEGMDAGNGVSINKATGQRLTSNSSFYRKIYADKGRAPTKAEWFDEARRQIENGRAGFGASEGYKEIKAITPETARELSRLDPEGYAAAANAGKIVVEQPNVPLKKASAPKKPLAPPPLKQNLSGPSVPSIPSTPKDGLPINTKNYDLNPKERAVLKTSIKQVTPELEKVKGGVLKNKDVLKAAQQSEILQEVTTKEQTKQAAAAILKTRQSITSLDKEITRLIKSGDTAKVNAHMRDMIDSFRVVKSQLGDKARILQSGGIKAGETSTRAEILGAIAKIEGNTNKILEAAKSVDWDNAESVAKFYRTFVEPSASEVLKEYRYNNMLSSPKTQVRNAFSNVMQTFAVKPATIALQGHPLQAFQYEKGAVKALPQAFKAFGDAWSGKTEITKPDLKFISTGKLPRFATVPTRAMEASDKWFQAIISGGEMARGVGARQAKQAAEYSLFRQKLHPKGQGAVLNKIDDAIGAVDHIRTKVPGLGWAVPFIRTPMNFAKQWIEYNPVTGPLTMIGASNKREQLAKTIIGSVATAYGASLAMEGRTTWAVPTDPKEKELFYAAGKKPYSIKIGNKWVPMIYFGPMTLAMGMPAAAKYYQDESKTALSDNQVAKLGRAVAGLGKMWTQQTFVQGIGSFVNLASGDVDFNVSRNLAGFARQTVPATGLLNYITSVMDPIYRKPSGFADNLKTGIPGLSTQVKPYTLPTGEPSTRLPVNKFLPYDVGQANPEFEGSLKARTQKLQGNALIDSLTQKATNSGIKSLPDGRVTVKIGDEYKPFDTESEAQVALAKEDLKKSGKSFKVVGNSVVRLNSAGEPFVTPKVQYDYQIGNATLTQQKKSGDIQGWLKTANSQLESIQKQLQDPAIDPLDALTLQNQAQTLMDNMAKYQGYGGFTKPKTGGKASGALATSFKTSKGVKAPKIPSIKVKTAGTFKPIKTRKISVSKIPSSATTRKLG